MGWLTQIYATHPIAHAIGVLALVCLAGMIIGSVKFRGIGLGSAGVLFAGIVVGHFGKPVDHETLEFVKEFGLVLFVFTIGLQLGPGFIAALREQGLLLNSLAIAIILLGAILASLIGWILRLDPAATLGLLSGATTNTPSLGAVQQSLTVLPGVSPDRQELPALAYAVSYPAAIAGIIGSLLLLKSMFRIDPIREAENLASERQNIAEPLERRTLIVERQEAEGITIETLRGRLSYDLTVSRLRSASDQIVRIVTGTTILQRSDKIVAVGTARALDQLENLLGKRVDEDLIHAPGDIATLAVLVTSSRALRKTVKELVNHELEGIVVTRVTRADLGMSATPNLRLKFGDVLQIVGDQQSLQRAAKFLGNSVKELNETQFVPFFIGILLAIVFGTFPIAVPGLPQPLRLGLAGGALIVALALGRAGSFGSLVWHMPANVNLAFREFGISLFFASLGLMAGAKFFATVFSGEGLLWLVAGLFITTIPVIAVGSFARLVLKMNYAVLSGLLAGSLTDPPALAFASNMSRSDAPIASYATVYPLTMFLRILTAQVLVLIFCG